MFKQVFLLFAGYYNVDEGDQHLMNTSASNNNEV